MTYKERLNELSNAFFPVHTPQNCFYCGTSKSSYKKVHLAAVHFEELHYIKL